MYYRSTRDKLPVPVSQLHEPQAVVHAAYRLFLNATHKNAIAALPDLQVLVGWFQQILHPVISVGSPVKSAVTEHKVVTNAGKQLQTDISVASLESAICKVAVRIMLKIFSRMTYIKGERQA